MTLSLDTALSDIGNVSSTYKAASRPTVEQDKMEPTITTVYMCHIFYVYTNAYVHMTLLLDTSLTNIGNVSSPYRAASPGFPPCMFTTSWQTSRKGMPSSRAKCHAFAACSGCKPFGWQDTQTITIVCRTLGVEGKARRVAKLQARNVCGAILHTFVLYKTHTRTVCARRDKS